jgi:two-component system sensor histidine kinase ChiS
MHKNQCHCFSQPPGKYKRNPITSIIVIILLLVGLGLQAVPLENKPWTAYKHPVKFGSLSVEDGLSQGSVLCILQDSKGFMWFGTEDGLNRYDGYVFKIYRPEPGNPTTISNNIILALYEDSKERLWIGTNAGGMDLFDRLHEQFIHYHTNANDPASISSNSVNCIYEDRSGNLWVGTGGGGLNKLVLNKSDGASLGFVNFQNDPDNPTTLSNNNVISIYEDHLGILRIGTAGGGLNKMIPGDNENSPPSFIHYKANPNNPDTFGLTNVMAINEDQHGTLWIGTQNGLYEFDRDKETFKRYNDNPVNDNCISHHYIRRIYKDRAGILWVGTDGGGLNKMIPGDSKGSSPGFIPYWYDPNNPHCLKNNAVESIYEDRSGVLWIGIYRGGLNKLILRDIPGVDREKNQFIHYQTVPNNHNSLSNNAVNAICEDRRGILWVGTDGGGLNKITPPGKEGEPLTFHHYHNDPGNPDSLSDNIVTCICEDHLGVLWIGTYTGGLNKLEPVTDNNEYNQKFLQGIARKAQSAGRKANNRIDAVHQAPSAMRQSSLIFTHYKNEPGSPNSLSNNFIMTIYEDRSGVLWIGTIDGGLNRFDRNSETFSHYQNSPGNPNSLSGNSVFSIHEDRSGNLWVGTLTGLNQLTSHRSPGNQAMSNHFTRYSHQPGNPNSLSNNFVRVIHEDRSGALWIGTNGGGLNQLIPGEHAGAPPGFRCYREEDGLPNNVIVGILEDNQGNLWISTQKGISKFNPGTGQFTNYDGRDGLQSDEFNRGAFFKNKNGEMFFGGNNGFNIFNPGSIKGNSYIPPIVITDFQLFNRSLAIGKLDNGRTILRKSITDTREIELSHKDYVFSLEFAALHYVNPSKNQYAYIMEGLDSQWNYVGSRHFVTYTTLPPGKYVFRVKGSNNAGVWNEQGVSLHITLTPPFYHTWWFYGLAALVIILAGLGIHFYRVRQIVRKMHKKYEKTHISPDKEDAYLKILLNYMKIAKPYLAPDLTLHKLSKLVTVPYHYLSQIINNRLNKIFFDFINQYRIEEALKKLADPEERQKSIHQVAHEVGFNSQSAFNRAFKKVTGKTPSDFINQYRIHEAAQRLADPKEKQKSIRQIALEVGFGSQSAFNRAFKKITRYSPSKYRKKKCN